MNNALTFWATEAPTIASLESGIRSVLADGARSIMMLCAPSDEFHPNLLDPILQELTVPVFGGIYPAFMHDGKMHKSGCLLVGFPLPLKTFVYDQLDRASSEMYEMSHSPLHEATGELRQFLLFIDGLSASNEHFINCLYEIVGSGRRFVGGGAGSLDLIQRPCVISNHGLLQDAAVAVGLPWHIELGVSHGWDTRRGPFLATETDGNRVISINYEPAFAVYRRVVESLNEKNFDQSDFFAIAAHYPLGVQDIHGEILVRDPIATENMHLLCVGEVLPNAMIHILQGNTDNLVASAGGAARESSIHCAQQRSAGYSIVFDCISRVLFMGADFQREIDAMLSSVPEQHTLFGVLSLGEISTAKTGAINWLNKSTVVGSFSIDE